MPCLSPYFIFRKRGVNLAKRLANNFAQLFRPIPNESGSGRQQLKRRWVDEAQSGEIGREDCSRWNQSGWTTVYATARLGFGAPGGPIRARLFIYRIRIS